LGITSFLLVIFYKNRKRLGSGFITALTNRIGDCLLIVCLGCLVITDAHSLPLLLLLLLSLTKSAQYPFSAWLPAAMAAPTPVRTLVHSSTLVTAGVYMLIRYCLVELHYLIVVGSLTTLIAGLAASVEIDLKKVVALRTLSQLGIIVVSLGAGRKSYCFFHLLTHACFKALLFICVGCAIHAVYGTQEFRTFNRISSTLTLILFTSLALLSLIGFPFMSGFFSKDKILEVMLGEGIAWSVVLFLIGIGVTAHYSVKILICTYLRNVVGRPGSLCLGGLRWRNKVPIRILGVGSLTFGAQYRSFCSPIQVVGSDSLAPFSMILLGLLIGLCYAPWKNHKYSRLIGATPQTQLIGSFALLDHKRVDKGWM